MGLGLGWMKWKTPRHPTTTTTTTMIIKMIGTITRTTTTMTALCSMQCPMFLSKRYCDRSCQFCCDMFLVVISHCARGLLHDYPTLSAGAHSNASSLKLAPAHSFSRNVMGSKNYYINEYTINLSLVFSPCLRMCFTSKFCTRSEVFWSLVCHQLQFQSIYFPELLCFRLFEGLSIVRL